MEKENHPVLERYNSSPLQFNNTAGVINIPTLAILEEAMETTATACDSNCLVHSFFCSSRASMCGCFKTGYFDARFHDYDKNYAIHVLVLVRNSSAEKINENLKSLSTMIVNNCSKEIEGEIDGTKDSGMSAGMSAGTTSKTKPRYGTTFFIF